MVSRKYPRTAYSHTEAGIATIAQSLIQAWYERFLALAEGMFIWEDSSGKCDTMFEISRKHAPEKYLLHNSRVAIFDYAGETHMLPVTNIGTVNIYGYPSKWQVVPECCGTLIGEDIYNLVLDNKNSVVMENSLYGTRDAAVIRDMVTMMVDTILTLYQRSLAARNPVILSVNGQKDKDAEQFVNSLLNFAPAIIQNDRGSAIRPEVLDMSASIDPELMEAISYFKTQLLIYIGYRANDIRKRAQVSVPEALMPLGEVTARWKEKLRCRQTAVDFYNKKFGNDIQVTCVCEELEEEDLEVRGEMGGGM